MSAAHPKIADYPFTTLVPNLGVVAYGDAEPFVMADIPGLIEGAHKGAGLGFRFLRHIERTKIILHVVDISGVSLDKPLQPWHKIETELRSYSEAFMGKKRVIALNKIDLLPDEEKLQAIIGAYQSLGVPVCAVSALTKKGLPELARVLVRLLGSN